MESEIMEGITILKRIYTDENAVELNEKIENILNSLKKEYMEDIETLNDLTLDNTEKRYLNTYELNAEELSQIAILSTKVNCLSDCIYQLEEAIYNGYETTPISNRKKNAEGMNKEESIIWAIRDVRPLILEGETKASEIARRFSLETSTCGKRTRRAFGIGWYEFVKKVQNGEL